MQCHFSLNTSDLTTWQYNYSNNIYTVFALPSTFLFTNTYTVITVLRYHKITSIINWQLWVIVTCYSYYNFWHILNLSRRKMSNISLGGVSITEVTSVLPYYTFLSRYIIRVRCFGVLYWMSNDSFLYYFFNKLSFFRLAVEMNVLGVRKMIDLCKTFKKLEVSLFGVKVRGKYLWG